VNLNDMVEISPNINHASLSSIDNQSFFGTLFYDTFSVTRLYSIDDTEDDDEE
jgi:hypothetical protein